ncbi:phosphoenolpyruvate--protein phosphotransferase [Desulfobulbus sp.]|uniref:phosphoenolpyruvate--protein phosphotransferase n=1 Tax=Desulfobulbus sp. TaxID=895 RepID=UPI00286F9827|nr:phosphoenolpyruvate--protein phosphotransferase [Desulfobulbus sp.]
MDAQSTSSFPGSITLLAPLTGVLVPIEQVPDPVFAEKMVGEGVSIDPLSNRLLAPCDGEVILIHPSCHAITVRHLSGLEVLMHIGLDTVSLRGAGFTPKVELGAAVRTGQVLIEFDLDAIATSAKSLLTQIVISNSELLGQFIPQTGAVTAGEGVVARAILGGGQTEGDQQAGQRVMSEAILVPNPTGLHARPAATLATLAKQYACQIRLQRGDSQANAKSLVAVMGLEVGHGDTVRVIAYGEDANLAVAAIAAAIASGLGEEGVVPVVEAQAPPAAEEAPLVRPRSGDPNVLVGVSASPGLAVGTIVQLRHKEIEVEEFAPDKHLERRRLNTAIDRAILALRALETQLKSEAFPDKAAIFAAHQELLADPDLLDLATSLIDKGKSAPFSWRNAYETYANRLANLKNAILAGRATDVRDVGQRVLEELTGQPHRESNLPTGCILIAEDLTPSDTASMDRTRVAGFCTTSGGASSHAAILARSFDIPAIAGIEARALGLEEGLRVILDGGKGQLRINVTEAEIREIKDRQERLAKRRAADLAAAGAAAVTTDGHQVEVVANIGSQRDALEALGHGAEGVGLLRSEFIFLGRATAPSEEEQTQIYTGIAQVLSPGQPLVIRTLDVGGDKPLPYLPIPREENPFLGERGIRVGLDRPDILRAQARAILGAVKSGAKIQVMFPMIATLQEFRLAKQVFEEEREKLGVDPVPLGIMVEVPAAAVMAAQFAPEVDFFSVGTNDLTQYTLAMDRGHPKLAPQVDGLNPAVLALIATAVEAAHRHGKWVGICGGIGSDPQAVPLLVGLGVDELSVSIPAIPAVKAQIRAISLAHCQELAATALRLDSAAAVRALVPVDEI